MELRSGKKAQGFADKCLGKSNGKKTQKGADKCSRKKTLTLASSVCSNDLILDRIFSFLKIDDLKSCRLVNSQWLDVSQGYFNEESVITIEHEVEDETAHDFLLTFKDPPMFLMFTGVCIQFEGSLTFTWKNHPILDFLKEYGNQIRYLKIKVVDGEVSTDMAFFAFKKILSELTPGLLHLCVDIHFCHAVVSTVNHKALDAAADLKLPKLKKLEWSTFTDDWWDYPTQRFFQSTFTPPFLDLLKSAPNLSSIVTEGSSFTSEAFDRMTTKEDILRIKDISVHPINTLHHMHTFLNKLTDLSQKNLKLTSFSIEACGISESWPLWKHAFFISLLRFLNTQKDCLQKLTLRVPMFDLPFSYHSLLPFPKMAKVKFLDINSSRSFLKMLLGDSHETWNDLFPDLQTLKFAYDFCYSFYEVTLLRRIFGATVNTAVTYVRLHPKPKGLQTIGAYEEITSVATLVRRNYDFVKTLFPNMQTLEIIDGNSGMYLFHRSRDYRYIER